jgi:hypothetical protein
MKGGGCMGVRVRKGGVRLRVERKGWVWSRWGGRVNRPQQEFYPPVKAFVSACLSDATGGSSTRVDSKFSF